MIEPERTPYGDVFLIIGIFAAIFMLIVFYVAANQEPEPVPDPVVVTIAPTEIPTTAPTPMPVPTESQQELMARTNGFHMREWLHWFRPDVTGINTTLGSKDLSAWVTVYDYLFMDVYHYHSVSWGTTAFFRESPQPGYKYLFVFVNYYTDGDDVRPWVFDASRFAVHANGIAYYPDDIYNPRLSNQGTRSPLELCTHRRSKRSVWLQGCTGFGQRDYPGRKAGCNLRREVECAGRLYRVPSPGIREHRKHHSPRRV